MALVWILSILVFGFLGLLTWTSSEVVLAIREVAVNTRREGAPATQYSGIQILSVLIKVSAVLTWVLGLVFPIALTAIGSSLGDIFEAMF